MIDVGVLIDQNRLNKQRKRIVCELDYLKQTFDDYPSCMLLG